MPKIVPKDQPTQPCIKNLCANATLRIEDQVRYMQVLRLIRWIGLGPTWRNYLTSSVVLGTYFSDKVEKEVQSRQINPFLHYSESIFFRVIMKVYKMRIELHEHSYAFIIAIRILKCNFTPS